MGKSSSLITCVSHWPSENGQIPKKYSFLWFWQNCLFLLQSKPKLSLEIFVLLMVVEMMMVARGATDSGVNATVKAVQLSEASSRKTRPRRKWPGIQQESRSYKRNISESGDRKSGAWTVQSAVWVDAISHRTMRKRMRRMRNNVLWFHHKV